MKDEKRNLTASILLILAFLVFQVFNYSTTVYALNDMLGEFTFLGVSWAVVLSVAFCEIDLIGVAQLSARKHGVDEPAGLWYLFGAFMLGAAMNATLTWWAITLVMSVSGVVTAWIPVFLAIFVWAVRVLIVGTFLVYGKKLFSK